MSCESLIKNLTLLWVMPNTESHKNYDAFIQKVLGQKINLEIAYSGLEAITAVRKKDHDLILIQNPLPDISVQFTIATIRYFEFLESKYTPIIILCHKKKRCRSVENDYLLEQTEAILCGSIRSKSTQQSLNNLIIQLPNSPRSIKKKAC